MVVLLSLCIEIDGDFCMSKVHSAMFNNNITES